MSPGTKNAPDPKSCLLYTSLKVIRVMVLFRLIRRGFLQQIHPNVVKAVMLDERYQSELNSPFRKPANVRKNPDRTRCLSAFGILRKRMIHSALERAESTS